MPNRDGSSIAALPKKKISLFLSPYFLIFNFFITSSPSESVVMYPSFSFCIRPYKTICWPILLLC
ncbi:metallothionein-like protein 3B [Iris pallida]|uniref:Metallothionein-like protein 3B n=1 Tax=Iris pallida TaxID=29817 RepID=A0AAX6H513_IRIPA|nr:metallothionein-like protein 3B [Iris pallida]